MEKKVTVKTRDLKPTKLFGRLLPYEVIHVLLKISAQNSCKTAEEKIQKTRGLSELDGYCCLLNFF